MPPRDRLIRLHIQNDPLSPNDAVTPPRFAKGATGFPELRRPDGESPSNLCSAGPRSTDLRVASLVQYPADLAPIEFDPSKSRDWF